MAPTLEMRVPDNELLLAVSWSEHPHRASGLHQRAQHPSTDDVLPARVTFVRREPVRAVREHRGIRFLAPRAGSLPPDEYPNTRI